MFMGMKPQRFLDFVDQKLRDQLISKLLWPTFNTSLAIGSVALLLLLSTWVYCEILSPNDLCDLSLEPPNHRAAAVRHGNVIEASTNTTELLC